LKKTLITILLTVMPVLAASDAMALFAVEGRYWFTSIDSKIRISSGSAAGTEIDPVGDLGFEKKKNFWEVRASLGDAANKIRYSFVPFKWDATANISRSIVFNGKTYSASTPVTSELKVNYHRLGWEYDFVEKLNNRFGYIFDIKYFDISASINAPSVGLDESKSMKVAVPTMGFILQIGLPYLINVSAEATGAKVASDKYLYDAEAAVNMKLAPFLSLSGGYRVLKFHFEKDNDLGAFSLKGPYAALKADF